jgi:hypothetical protein
VAKHSHTATAHGRTRSISRKPVRPVLSGTSSKPVRPVLSGTSRKPVRPVLSGTSAHSKDAAACAATAAGAAGQGADPACVRGASNTTLAGKAGPRLRRRHRRLCHSSRCRSTDAVNQRRRRGGSGCAGSWRDACLPRAHWQARAAASNLAARLSAQDVLWADQSAFWQTLLQYLAPHWHTKPASCPQQAHSSHSPDMEGAAAEARAQPCPI